MNSSTKQKLDTGVENLMIRLPILFAGIISLFCFLPFNPASADESIVYACGAGRHFGFATIDTLEGHLKRRRENYAVKTDSKGNPVFNGFEHGNLARSHTLNDQLDDLAAEVLLMTRSYTASQDSYPHHYLPTAYLYFLTSGTQFTVPHIKRWHLKGEEFSSTLRIASDAPNRNLFPTPYHAALISAFARGAAKDSSGLSSVLEYLVGEAQRWSEIIGPYSGNFARRTPAGPSKGYEYEELGKLYFHIGKLITISQADATIEYHIDAEEAFSRAAAYLQPKCNPLLNALTELELINPRIAQTQSGLGDHADELSDLISGSAKRIEHYLEIVRQWESAAFDRIAGNSATRAIAGIKSICSTFAEPSKVAAVCQHEFP